MSIMVRRITNNAIWLTILCVVGMIGISLGGQTTLSFQLLVFLLMFMFSQRLVDKIIVSVSYLFLGLIIPIYAGFHSGITPTFGYVIGFVVSSIPFHFLYKLKINNLVKYIIASSVSLLTIYVCGITFIVLYTEITIISAITTNLIFYLIGDIIKIVFAYLIQKLLPEKLFIHKQK